MSSSIPPLISLCKQGEIPAVMALLANCPNPPESLLDMAYLASVEQGHSSLLPHLAPFLSTPVPHLHRRGEPAIAMAARLGHIACIDELLKAGALPDQTCKCSGRTALMTSVEHGHIESVQALIKAKANVNLTDVDGNSALHIAAAQGDSALVALLLEAGAACTPVNEDDETPLELSGNCDVARTMLEAMVQYPDESTDSGAGCSAPSFHAALRLGPAAVLFWSAIGVGRDNIMFQQFGVYPFDRLNDTERILLLTEVCEGVAGYRNNLVQDVLRDSTRFAVFAMVKARIKKEVELHGHGKPDKSPEDQTDTQFEWRKKVLSAFESIFKCSGASVGLSVDCVKRVVWNTAVNMIAKHTDRDRAYFWDKRRSKTYLLDDVSQSSGCFCQECIAEREVPLAFKLQFLDDNAHSLTHHLSKYARKQGRGIKKVPLLASSCPSSSLSSAIPFHSAPSPLSSVTRSPCATLRERCDDLILTASGEICKFWCNLNTEEKWLLTEISTHELADLISEPRINDWESLRAALSSYSLYQWEEDLLEINDDCVTIIDDMSESKDLNDLIHVVLEAAFRVLVPSKLDSSTTSGVKSIRSVLDPPPDHCQSLCRTSSPGARDECQRCLSDEEWDRRGRQQLENIVMCEFARKISCSYLYASEASRAQRIALELELELLQEEEQMIKLTEKKQKRRKAKSKKKRGRRSAAATSNAMEPSSNPGDEENDSDSNDVDDIPLPIPIVVPAVPAVVKPASVPPPPVQPVPVNPSERAASPEARPSGPRPLAPTSESQPSSYENGMMFISTDDTYAECHSLGLFGLPRQHLDAVLECKPGGSTALFLFNISTRMLHGLYEPTAPGRDTIDPSAWSRPAGGQTPFPAQVAFTCVDQRPPLAESAFRHIFPDGNRIRKLTGAQVQTLLHTWSQPVQMSAKIAPPISRKSISTRPVSATKSAKPAPRTKPSPAPMQILRPTPTPLLSRPVPTPPPSRPSTPLYPEPALGSCTIWSPHHQQSSWDDASSTQYRSQTPTLLPTPSFVPAPPLSTLRSSSTGNLKSLNLFGDWNGIWTSPSETATATW